MLAGKSGEARMWHHIREKTIILNVDETSTINKVILSLVHPQSDRSKGGSVWARQEV